MLHISLAIDHNYYNLGFENQAVGVVLDLSKYSYYALTKDLELIDIDYQPSMPFGVNEKLNIGINPKATLYRLPIEYAGRCPFWYTNMSIPVDKLEFFETNQNYYGKYCALWKPTMRPEIGEGQAVSELYSSVHRTTPNLANKHKLKNFKASELLSNILDKLEVSERLSVTLGNLSVSIRSDLAPLLSEEGLRWASPWAQNKSTSYLFLDEDNVVCSDLATLKRNKQFDQAKAPWLAVINPDHGSVVIHFNQKAYESKLSLLQSLFPEFKTVKITKADALEALHSIVSAKDYVEAVNDLAKNFMDGHESLQVIVHGDNDTIFEVGRVEARNLDEVYIQVGVKNITNKEEREELTAEMTALLYSGRNCYDY